MLFRSFLALGIATDASAGFRDQAKRIHDRLVGTPPSIACLDQLEVQVTAGNAYEAALDVINNVEACTDPSFYNVTLKNFITPWTNEEQSVFAPLNDYTATVIGIIRDNLDFREVLYGNILYIGGNGVSPGYSNSSNAHYEAMEDQGANLADPDQLRYRTQTEITGLPDTATAGIITTRAAARAFFIDGTNRAMFRFTLLNHLCTDLEQIKDPTRTHDRIPQDVARSPGGDSRIFMNARTTKTLILTALGLFRTLAAISAPCSVKTQGNVRRPPRPGFFAIAFCDIKAVNSSRVTGNAKSSGNRRRLRLTASLKRCVGTPYSLARSESKMTR